MKRVLRGIAKWCLKAMHKFTFFVSKTTTAVVLTFGALAGINRPERLYIAMMAFTIGLPIGWFIWGLQFSILTWLLIVVGLLFMMNLHNTWEVIVALKAGGLDYQMVAEAVNSVSTVTPDPEDIERLNKRIGKLNANVKHMHSHHDGYDGKVLSPLIDLPQLKGSPA